jgi:hypothetical protein
VTVPGVAISGTAALTGVTVIPGVAVDGAAAFPDVQLVPYVTMALDGEYFKGNL